MAIHHLDFTAIPTATRATMGRVELSTLRARLRDPSLTEAQKAAIQEKITQVNTWMAASATDPAPRKVGKPPTQHTVTVQEEIQVKDKSG